MASILTDVLNGFGGATALMAIGIFVGQAPRALAESAETEIRRAATIGGLVGLCGGLVALVLSMTIR